MGAGGVGSGPTPTPEEWSGGMGWGGWVVDRR